MIEHVRYGALIQLFYHPGQRIALQTFNWS